MQKAHPESMFSARKALSGRGSSGPNDVPSSAHGNEQSDQRQSCGSTTTSVEPVRTHPPQLTLRNRTRLHHRLPRAGIRDVQFVGGHRTEHGAAHNPPWSDTVDRNRDAGTKRPSDHGQRHDDQHCAARTEHDRIPTVMTPLPPEQDKPKPCNEVRHPGPPTEESQPCVCEHKREDPEGHSQPRGTRCRALPVPERHQIILSDPC